ncbi:MAG: nucleotide-binding universal stress UspA family protein [Bacteroidia bacterium]|jgi:nucleotide-binding universal stress UspA family protein
MKKIAALIDFTDICGKALEFAGNIAAQTNAELVLVHVADFSDQSRAKEVEDKLYALHSEIPNGVRIEDHVSFGAFFSVIPTIITDLNIDFVVVPTHGKVGLMQNLLGSNILKLVKTLPVPALVVQAGSTYSSESFDKLIFPVGPHINFDVKIKQTTSFARFFDSTVVVYMVKNDIRGLSEDLRNNFSESKKYFASCGVNYTEVREEPAEFSAGYAKHILNYARGIGECSICIMSEVSDTNGYIGNNDKENILLNDMAVPVFCANA